MAQMNWGKVQQQNRMRRQGSVRVLTEEAERRLKALRGRKRPKRQRPGGPKQTRSGDTPSVPRQPRAVRFCPYCNAPIRLTRYDHHITLRCTRRAQHAPAAESLLPYARLIKKSTGQQSKPLTTHVRLQKK